MRISRTLAIFAALTSVSLPACNNRQEKQESEDRKIVLTSPKEMDVVITQKYVCQIHSRRHIKVRALQSGYLESIPVKEGQEVKGPKYDRDGNLLEPGQLMFKVIPILYKAKFDAELAEAKLAELELKNTKSLFEQKPPVVSANEVLLFEAKLAKAQAKAKLAEAEWKFTEVRAPFDGIIDRQEEQHGSLIKEGDVLTTLSDNSLMWVYFNVPEKQYIEYKKTPAKEKEAQKIELILADGTTFKEPGKIGAIEARFNNENGNIAFRADFKNPDHLLRHGMTGSILIHRTLKNAIVIPQRGTFEILDKQYVYVVDKDNLVHQREIKVEHELPDIFVIKSGVGVSDKFVYEGTRQVRDGGKAKEAEFRPPEKILGHQTYHAE
jgi:membrane fusion protein, multidrug efflux system